MWPGDIMYDAISAGVILGLILIMGPLDPQWYHWLLIAAVSILAFFVGDTGPGGDGGAG